MNSDKHLFDGWTIEFWSLQPILQYKEWVKQQQKQSMTSIKNGWSYIDECVNTFKTNIFLKENPQRAYLL